MTIFHLIVTSYHHVVAPCEDFGNAASYILQLDYGSFPWESACILRDKPATRLRVTRMMALGRRYFFLCWLRALVTWLSWSTAGLRTPTNTVLRKITVGGIGLCPPAPRASTLVHEHFHGVSQMGQTRGALGVRGTTAGLYPPSGLLCMASTFKYIQRPWEDDAGSRRTSSFSRE